LSRLRFSPLTGDRGGTRRGEVTGGSRAVTCLRCLTGGGHCLPLLRSLPRSTVTPDTVTGRDNNGKVDIVTAEKVHPGTPATRAWSPLQPPHHQENTRDPLLTITQARLPRILQNENSLQIFLPSTRAPSLAS
jgi:hypothetical protein